MARAILFLFSVLFFVSFVAAASNSTCNWDNKYKKSESFTPAGQSTAISVDETLEISDDGTFTYEVSGTNCTVDMSGTWTSVVGLQTNTTTFTFKSKSCNATGVCIPICTPGYTFNLLGYSNCTLNENWVKSGGLAGWVIAIIVVAIVLVVGVVVGLFLYRRHKHHQRNIYETA